MSPEREPMENDSNSCTAEELEQQTVDVYVERALHGPVFRMSYEHTHTYCEIFYLKSFTDFLIIFSNLRKCRKGLEYQAFPAFCVLEDTPHIMAFRSLTWR